LRRYAPLLDNADVDRCSICVDALRKLRFCLRLGTLADD
jgi:hypothetical protein